MTERGVVAAGHPATAGAGAAVLRAGGNAVDAAIAAVLTSFVAEPLLTGLGAGGYMLVALPGQEPVLLDFFVEAPGRNREHRGRAPLTAVDVSFGDASQMFYVGAASVGAYGLVSATWQAAGVYLIAASLNALLMVGWSTLLQTHVPRELLGRVASLDWMISFGLIPVSFALTGPLAGAFGPQATLIGAGLLGGGASVTVWVLARLHTVDAELDGRVAAPAAAQPALA